MLALPADQRELLPPPWQRKKEKKSSYKTFDKLVSLLHIKWPKYIDCLYPLVDQIYFSGPLQGALGLLPYSFSRREKNYLSLDIGSSSVKMLEVRGSGTAINVLNASITQLPANAVQGNVVQDSESVTRVIQTFKEKHHIKATEVIASVPGPAVIVKRATFPAQSPQELEETILFEAGNFIPESLDDVNLDYQVLNKNLGADSVEVLLVAVRKDVLNSYVTAISKAGLVPVVVDVDYFALENMFEVNYPSNAEEVIALINIGARYSSINILKGKQSIFTSDAPVGGRELTQALVRELGLNSDQAEVVKMKGQKERKDRKEEIEKIIAVTTEHLLDEIQHVLSFFWTGSVEEQISAAYVSGGTAQLPGLASLMSERLQIPVEISNPFRQINISRQADERFIRQNAPTLAVSVGLATRRPGDQ